MVVEAGGAAGLPLENGGKIVLIGKTQHAAHLAAGQVFAQQTDGLGGLQLQQVFVDADVGVLGKGALDTGGGVVQFLGDLLGGDPAAEILGQQLHDAAVQPAVLGVGQRLYGQRCGLAGKRQQKQLQKLRIGLDLHLLILALFLHGAQVVLHAEALLAGEVVGGVCHQRLQPCLLVGGEDEGAVLQLLQKSAGGGKADDVGVQILPLQRPKAVEFHGLVEDHIALFHGVDLLVGGGTEGAVGGIDQLPKGMELAGEVVGVGKVAGQAVV